MKTHYSIDLETLGTRYDSYILSIGVAAFNIETGEILNEFHLKTVCPNDEFHIDVGTVIWWLDQSEAARKAIIDREGALPICTVLDNLSFFITDYENAIVWGNGSSFDITLLDHAYHKCGLKQPWQFWNVRDMRTIVDAAIKKGFDKKAIPFEGFAHDALADAKHQARIIAEGHCYLWYGTYLHGASF